MAKNILQTIALFIILGLIQVLVCNNISILNIATPFIFIYVIARLPLDLSANWAMTCGFFAGLIIDIFSDTQGMNALASTILAASRHPIAKLYIAHNNEITDPIPSPKSLGPGAYLKYLLTITFLYCLIVTFVEAFSLNNLLISVYRVFGCTTISFVILLGVDAIVNAKNEKRL